MKRFYFLFIAFATPALLPAQIDSDRADSIVAEAVQKQIFSGNILIAVSYKPIYQKSVGFADEVNEMRNTGDTRFSIGSITKLFTKAIVLQLCQERKLKLQSTISDYFDALPDKFSAITVEQLLDHTSGLGNYFDVDGFQNAEIRSPIDLLRWIKQESLEFEPGQKVRYSNSGYVLLALIIEKVTNKSFSDNLQDRIFRKTGMSSSGFSMTNSRVEDKAVGYLTNRVGPKRDNLHLRLIGYGDGGIFTTANDLLKFDSLLSNGNTLLTDDNKLKLFNSKLAPVVYTSWKDFLSRGRFLITGGDPGASAAYGKNFNKNLTIIVLSNYDEGSAEEVVARLSALLNGAPVESFEVPPSKVIYGIIDKIGASAFELNYKEELSRAGIQLNDDMILLSVGQVLLQEKRYIDAIALYKVYTREFPRIIVAWNDLGDAYLAVNEKAKAKECFENALKLAPQNSRAKDRLQRLHE